MVEGWIQPCCKNFCKCHNPPPSTTMKIKELRCGFMIENIWNTQRVSVITRGADFSDNTGAIWEPGGHWHNVLSWSCPSPAMVHRDNEMGSRSRERWSPSGSLQWSIPGAPCDLKLPKTTWIHSLSDTH
jgi:hypothetical protein